jgi:Pyruvate/2-oxoacid:ferredoxin oxidoreductase gamma subunit
VPIDGRAIAIRFEMGKVVNSALLGAMAGILGQPHIDTLCDVIEQTAPSRKEQNVAACRHAYAVAREAVAQESVA